MLEEHLDHFLRQACSWGDSSVVKVLALPTELTRKKPDMVPLLVIPALRKPTGRSLGLSSQPMRVPMRDPVSKYTVAGGLGATPEVVLWTPRVWTLTHTKKYIAFTQCARYFSDSFWSVWVTSLFLPEGTRGLPSTVHVAGSRGWWSWFSHLEKGRRY